MMDFRYLLPAEEELIGAARYYEVEAKGLGVDFLGDVQRAIDRVCENPKFGQVIDEHLRRCLLSRFPFSLIYGIDKDSIVIVAVTHQRRRPDYWRERVDL